LEITNSTDFTGNFAYETLEFISPVFWLSNSPDLNPYQQKIWNKSSAVAEMGDRGHNIHGPKRGGAAMLLSRELEPRLTQWALDRGLLPDQVASSSIQPFGHNRHRLKIGWGRCAFFLGVAGSPSNTKSPGPRPTSTQSGILVDPAVWPQRTLDQNCEDVPLYGRGAGSHRVSRGLPPYQVAS